MTTAFRQREHAVAVPMRADVKAHLGILEHLKMQLVNDRNAVLQMYVKANILDSKGELTKRYRPR